MEARREFPGRDIDVRNINMVPSTKIPGLQWFMILAHGIGAGLISYGVAGPLDGVARPVLISGGVLLNVLGNYQRIMAMQQLLHLNHNFS